MDVGDIMSGGQCCLSGCFFISDWVDGRDHEKLILLRFHVVSGCYDAFVGALPREIIDIHSVMERRKGMAK